MLRRLWFVNNYLRWTFSDNFFLIAADSIIITILVFGHFASSKWSIFGRLNFFTFCGRFLALIFRFLPSISKKIISRGVVLSAGKRLVNVYVIWPWGQLLQRVLQKHKFWRKIITQNFLKKYSWVGENKLVVWCYIRTRYIY